VEKRKYRRVRFEVTATVQTDRTSIGGMVDNLSMKGMFITTGETIPDDGPFKISITLSGSSSTLSITLKGRAVRHTDTGVAIEFQEMDLDSFMHLRNIIAQNCDDPDALCEEYCRSIMPSPDDSVN